MIYMNLPENSLEIRAFMSDSMNRSFEAWPRFESTSPYSYKYINILYLNGIFKRTKKSSQCLTKRNCLLYISDVISLMKHLLFCMSRVETESGRAVRTKGGEGNARTVLCPRFYFQPQASDRMRKSEHQKKRRTQQCSRPLKQGG